MRFSIEMSVRGESAEPASVAAIARAAENAGFAMLGFTDHPAPSEKWLRTGGHPTYDPFAALCFVAAVTSRIRLMTYLAVLPYRNPFLLAKSVSTVDRLSAGRFTLVAGTGYLRSEFAALGADFDGRNRRFEQAVEVLRSGYSADGFSYEGDGFTGFGVVHDPLPVQLPHPPIWIGGSSRASRQRAARYGDGWAPLLTNEAFARVVRTAELATAEQVGVAIREFHDLLVAEGRDPSKVAVQLDGVGLTGDPAQALERVEEFGRVGVTQMVVRPAGDSVAAVVESVGLFGSEVITKLDNQ